MKVAFSRSDYTFLHGDSCNPKWERAQQRQHKHITIVHHFAIGILPKQIQVAVDEKRTVKQETRF